MTRKPFTTTLPTGNEATTCNTAATSKGQLLSSIAESFNSDAGNIIHFDDYFYAASIEKLIDKIEAKIGSSNGEEKDIYLYFASNGGYIYTLQRLVDYLENCNANVHLMMSWAASCGVYLPLMLMRTEKYALLKSTINVFPHNEFLFHLSDRGEWSTRAKKDDRNDRKDSDIAERASASLDKMIIELCEEAGMEKKHLKLIKKGQDVSYTSDEFDQMLTNVQMKYAPDFTAKMYVEAFEEGLNNGYFTLDFAKQYIEKHEAKSVIEIPKKKADKNVKKAK